MHALTGVAHICLNVRLIYKGLLSLQFYFLTFFPISKLNILVLEEYILVEYKLGNLQRFLMPLF